jgi:hypothetical protein
MLLNLSTYELLGTIVRQQIYKSTLICKGDCTVHLDLLDAVEAAWETEVGRGLSRITR